MEDTLTKVENKLEVSKRINFFTWYVFNLLIKINNIIFKICSDSAFVNAYYNFK